MNRDFVTLDTFPKILRDNAKVFKGRPSVREKEHGIWQITTWDEFYNKALLLAEAFYASGLRRGDKIYIPQFKEPHFFDVSENFVNGLEWYKQNYFHKANQKIIADFTPSYFFDSNAPKRIFDALGPKMKFLVILRNPVDRAYSHYLHSKRDFHESNDFLEALESEEIRLKGYIEKSDYFSYLRHSYVKQGLCRLNETKTLRLDRLGFQ